VLHGKFNAVGWPVMDTQLMPLVGALFLQLRLRLRSQQQHMQLTPAE
jgi:hypothetical protein